MTNRKVFGFWMLTALVAGNMIGSGIYTLPAALAKYGSISLFSWVFTSLGSVLLALVFSVLVKLLPYAGGPYVYCKFTFGRFVGFLIAYSYWIAIWIGNAAVAIAFTGYLSFFIPTLAYNQYLTFLTSVSIVWLVTFINMWELKFVGVIQIIMTILKLLPLFLMFFVGFLFISPANYVPLNVSHESNFNAFIQAATITLWAFIGLESATFPTDQVEEPAKNIPIATIVGTVLAAVVYIVSTFVIMGIIPNAQLVNSQAPFADAARLMFGNIGGYIFAIGAIFSCLGTLNGWILLQGQLPVAAAKDNLFPVVFTKVSSRGTPVYALIISSTLITILLSLNMSKYLIDQFVFIISLAVFVYLIPYLFSTIAAIIMFIKQPNDLNINIKKYSVIAGMAFLYSMWMVYGAGETVVFWGLLLVFTSIPVYAVILYTNKCYNKSQNLPDDR